MNIPLGQLEQLKAEIPDEVMTFASTYLIYYSFNLSSPNWPISTCAAPCRWPSTVRCWKARSSRARQCQLNYAGGFDPEYKGPDIAEAAMTQAGARRWPGFS